MHKKIYPLLIVLVLVTLSYGQDNTSANDTLALKKQSTIQPTSEFYEGPFRDPLFSIYGQLCAWVRVIHQDSHGNLWFGTNHYGVMRYDGDTLEYFSESGGFGDGRVNDIIEDDAGNVWFGTYGGLTKFDGNSFISFSLKEKAGLYKNDVWSMLIDSKGIFWICTSDGVSQFDGKEFVDFPMPKAEVKDTTSKLSYNRITSVMGDRDGNIWFGSDGFGIFRYDGEFFAHITKEDGLCGNNVLSLAEDSKGNIWIGAEYGGISRYDGDSFTNFTEDGIVSGIEIGGIYEDKRGAIWFTAEGHGVYRYDGATFTNFNAEDGLISKGIISMFEDNEGRFWFGGWLGLFRYDGESFFSVTKNGPWE